MKKNLVGRVLNSWGTVSTHLKRNLALYGSAAALFSFMAFVHHSENNHLSSATSRTPSTYTSPMDDFCFAEQKLINEKGGFFFEKCGEEKTYKKLGGTQETLNHALTLPNLNQFHATYLQRNTINISEVSALLSLEDASQQTIFKNISSALIYLKRGGSFAQAQAYVEQEDLFKDNFTAEHLGFLSEIKMTPQQFATFAQKEELCGHVTLQKKADLPKLIALWKTLGEPPYSSDDDPIKEHVSPGFSYFSLRTRDTRQREYPQDVNIEKILSLLAIQTPQGVCLFKDPKSVYDFLEQKGSVHLAQTLANLHTTKTPLFQDWEITAIAKQRTPATIVETKEGVERFRATLELKRRNGKPIFPYASQAIAFLHAGGNPTAVPQMLKLKNNKGNYMVFDWSNTLTLQAKKGLTIEQLKQLAKIGYDAHRTAVLAQYDVPVHALVGFKDTKKPNIFLAYPVHGPRAFSAQSAKSTVYHDLKALGYDVFAAIVNTKQELLTAAKKMGHIDGSINQAHGTTDELGYSGNGLGMVWGYGYEGFTLQKEDSYRLTTDDTSFIKQYLALHDSHGVLIFDTCSAGKGEEGAKNLANAFIAQATGQTIYAPTMDVEMKETHLGQTLGGQLSIFYFRKEQRHVTYTNAPLDFLLK